MNFAIGFGIILTVTSVASLGLYDIQQIQTNLGIYYEKFGTVRIKRVDWKINIVLEVETLLSNMKPKLSYGTILQHCMTKLSEDQCILALGVDIIDLHTKNINNLRKKTRETIESVGQFNYMPINEPKSIRRKRFVPLGIIGSLSSSLFGLVTEEEITNVNKNIDQLFKDQKDLTKLENKRAHIISSNFDELYNISKAHEEKINALEILLVDRMNQARKDENDLKFMFEMNAYVKSMEAKMLHLKDSCQELLDIMLALRDGKVHPKLLKIETLTQITRDINELNFDLDFPVPTRHIRIEEIQRISKVDAVKIGDRIIVVLHLPLVERVPYTLYKLHSFAVHQIHNNKTIGLAYVQPSHEYLILRADQNQYVQFNYELLNECIHTHYAYICPAKEPFREAAESNECEINMLLKPTLDSLRLCEIIYHNNSMSQWKYLSSDGSWIFSIIDKETIRISCAGKQEENLVLQGSGIFRLTNGCVGRTANTIIVREDSKNDGQQYVYRPEINLNISEIYPLFSNHIELDHANPLHNVKLSKWVGDKQKLSNIVQRMHDIGEHKREILQTNYTMFGGFILQFICILVLIILLKYFRMFKCCTARNKKEIPRTATIPNNSSVIIQEIPLGPTNNKKITANNYRNTRIHEIESA